MGGSFAAVRVAGFKWNGWQTSAVYAFTWEQAVEKIQQEAHRFGNKKDDLNNLRTIDRQTADIKHLINEIAEILDPKTLLWTVRLGKYIGKGKPDGILEQFIGPQIISVLWPEVEALQAAAST